MDITLLMSSVVKGLGARPSRYSVLAMRTADGVKIYPQNGPLSWSLTKSLISSSPQHLKSRLLWTFLLWPTSLGNLGKGFSHLSQEKAFLPLCSSFLCLLISAQARQEKAQPWKQQTWWETWSWRLCFLLCFWRLYLILKVESHMLHL